jgi:hypothetical protein
MIGIGKMGIYIIMALAVMAVVTWCCCLASKASSAID